MSEGRSELRSICVFCGSSAGHDPAYRQSAVAVGQLLARRGIRLVYGGGTVGLMGLVANAALSGGGAVIGVIPRGLFSQEVAHTGLTQLIEVESMHQRKMTMFELSDAFVALPGGLGTLEELFEVASWAQLGIHHKPLATLDVAGYWQPLHRLLRNAVDNGFMTDARRALIGNVGRLEDLLPTLGHYPSEHPEPVVGLSET